MTTTNALFEYENMLKTHDWFYAYSEDPSVYATGATNLTKLHTMAHLVDPKFELWNSVAPKQFTVDVDSLMSMVAEREKRLIDAKAAKRAALLATCNDKMKKVLEEVEI